MGVDKSTRQGTALCVDIRNEQGMAWEEGVISSSISRARVAALGGGQLVGVYIYIYIYINTNIYRTFKSCLL